MSRRRPLMGCPRYRSIRHLKGAVVAVVLLAFMSVGTNTFGQGLLYNERPYDVLITKPDAARHKVLPLLDRSGEVQKSGVLKVRLLSDPAEEKVISWSDIASIEIFEVLLLAEANQLAMEKKFDDAFRSYARLLREFPNVSQLKPSVEGYLYINAEDQIAKGALTLAMSTLEELFDRNPGYERNDGNVVSQLSTVASRMLEDMVRQKDFRAAREMILRLENTYGVRRLPATAQWKTVLMDMTKALMDEAKGLLEKEDYIGALRKVKEFMGIWPDQTGARELAGEVVRAYPIAVVGVMQRVNKPDPLRIDDWAARRAGRLTERSLVEFVSPGPEGGYYSSPFGSVEKSDDFRSLFFQMAAPARGPRLTSYELADWLLAMADPEGPFYQKRWAAVVDRVLVEDESRIRVDLRKPDVLPEGRLRVLLSDYPPLASYLALMRPYKVEENTDTHVRFMRNKEAISQGVSPPAEIYEQFYPDADKALADLRIGKIDVIDRLFPADAARLLADDGANVVVKPYALPTVHFLAINTDRHAYLANNAFRQAVIRTMPRELILDELLDGRALAGCRVVSAPIPAGRKINDTLAYAYNEKIKTRLYDNGIGKILLSVANAQFEFIAEKEKKDPPKIEPMVLAHPEDKIARFACQIIAQQLKLLGVETTLRQLPKGMSDDPKREYDLLYVAATISEPVVDIERLVGREGIGKSDDQYVNFYVRRIAESTNWREIRQYFESLHQTIAADVTVVPLWQLTEYYAHRPGVYGLDNEVVNLYQDVDNWVLDPNLADFEQ